MNLYSSCQRDIRGLVNYMVFFFWKSGTGTAKKKGRTKNGATKINSGDEACWSRRFLEFLTSRGSNKNYSVALPWFCKYLSTKIQLKKLPVIAEERQTQLKIPVCQENSPTNMFTSPSMKFFSSYAYFFCVSVCSALIQRMWKISAENGTQYDWKNCKQVQGSSNNNPDLGKYQNQY